MTCAVRLFTDPDLALHEKPTLPLAAVAFAAEQVRMIGEQLWSTDSAS